MRGKIVNLCIGCMNILFGLLLLVYTMYIPQELADLTVQELTVTESLLKVIYLILMLVFLIDLFQYHNNRDNSKMKTGYLFGFFIVSFFFIKEPAIALFSVISGMIVIFQTWKDTAVEIDSTTAISIVALIIVAIVMVMGITFFYKNIAQSIKNNQNKGSVAYKNDYFRYVTELDITDVYINVKKDGKYGYINQNGEVVIDFKYDYASPFVNITMYDKNFQVALVCQEGMTQIIMKNERMVMSYRSETAEDNYEAKRKEFSQLYTDTLKQSGEMQFEIQKKNDTMERAARYEEISNDYTYRYDYNEQYDILITQSNLGLPDKYELAKKENLTIRIALDCDQIDYDENFVYLYRNRTIPFFNLSSKEQGWFTNYGKKNIMSGKAQILDFIDDKILIRNYNDNTVYFIDKDGNILSDVYRDIYILEDRYIVKNNQDKYRVIGKDFNKVWETEYDVIDPYLVNYGLYICANTNEAIEFNDYGFAKMNWKLVNAEGQTILDGIEQIYGNHYQISNDKSVPYVLRYEQFLTHLKDIDFAFVGDKFYEVYTK